MLLLVALALFCFLPWFDVVWADVTGVSPASIAAGAGDTSITVSGAGSAFTSGFLVRINSVPLVTTYLGSYSLGAVVPSGMLSTDRSYTLDVMKPTGQLVAGTVQLTVGAGGIPSQTGMSFAEWESVLYVVAGLGGAAAFILGMGQRW